MTDIQSDLLPKPAREVLDSMILWNEPTTEAPVEPNGYLLLSIQESGLDDGIVSYYVQKAVTETCDDFMLSLDKIARHTNYSGSIVNNFIIPLKYINNLYWNNEQLNGEYGVTSTLFICLKHLPALFENVSKPKETTLLATQAYIKKQIDHFLAFLKANTPDEVLVEKTAAFIEIEKAMIPMGKDFAWRAGLELPLDQQLPTAEYVRNLIETLPTLTKDFEPIINEFFSSIPKEKNQPLVEGLVALLANKETEIRQTALRVLSLNISDEDLIEKIPVEQTSYFVDLLETADSELQKPLAYLIGSITFSPPHLAAVPFKLLEISLRLLQPENDWIVVMYASRILSNLSSNPTYTEHIPVERIDTFIGLLENQAVGTVLHIILVLNNLSRSPEHFARIPASSISIMINFAFGQQNSVEAIPSVISLTEKMIANPDYCAAIPIFAINQFLLLIMEGGYGPETQRSTILIMMTLIGSELHLAQIIESKDLIIKMIDSESIEEEEEVEEVEEVEEMEEVDPIEVKRFAVYALKQILLVENAALTFPQKSVSHLLNQLKSTDNQTRRFAAEALYHLSESPLDLSAIPNSHFSIFIPLLQKTDESTLSMLKLCWNLFIKNPDEIKKASADLILPLIDLLQTSDDEAKSYIIKILIALIKASDEHREALHTTGKIDSLTPLLKSDDNVVKDHATTLFSQLASKNDRCREAISKEAIDQLKQLRTAGGTITTRTSASLALRYLGAHPLTRERATTSSSSLFHPGAVGQIGVSGKPNPRKTGRDEKDNSSDRKPSM